MSDDPRAPGEPGWWVAGKWYPSDSGPATAAKTGARPARAQARSIPLWLRVAAPAIAVLVVAGIVAATLGSSSKHPKPSPVPRSAPSSVPGPVADTTTSIALSAESSTAVPVTRPPATQRPAATPRRSGA